eukprot:1151392-Pelagomonas_calceolata.AAC.6
MPSFREGGRPALAKNCLPNFLSQQTSTVPATASHAPLTPQGCLNFLIERLAKVSGQGVRWVGLDSRCELHRETGIGAHAS